MSRLVLVIASTKKPTAAQKVSGIYRYAKLCRWKVQLAIAPDRSSDIRDLLELWHPDGCIYEAGLTGNVPDLSSFAGYKTVFLDADRRLLPKNTPIVMHDSKADGRLAAKELLSIRRSSFAFVGVPGNAFWSRDRESAFLETLRLNGIRGARRLHPCAGSRDELKMSLEIAAFVKSLPNGCGIFAANDEIADKVLSVCNLTKRKVPADVAVIGVNNDETICTHASPTLSSIAPDLEHGGYLAAEMLDRLFSGKRLPTRKMASFGPIAIIRRASTASPSAYNGLAFRIVEIIRDSEGCITANEVIRKLSCVRRTAELHFRKASGKSILEAINEVRLETACLLLKQRLLPITVIANRVGYSSAIAFDRFFKSRTGQSPTEWREILSSSNRSAALS